MNGVVMICLYCGKTIPDTKANRKKKTRVCDNKCKGALTRQIKEEENRIVRMVSKPTHERKCRICNRPCWPNYFFCNEHFANATRQVSGGIHDANNMSIFT